MIVPLETVRGVYEKLSREAVEAHLTRPSPGQRIQQEHGKIGYHGDDLETGSIDVTESAGDGGRKNVMERAVTGTLQNGRAATSAPVTPLHRPTVASEGTCRDVTDTCRDVTDDGELPQRGITQALVAQWREMEERVRAETMAGRVRAGTSRSRSLSGLALRRGDSPSPARPAAEQGRSGADAEVSDVDAEVHSPIRDDDDFGEQDRSGAIRQQRTGEDRHGGDADDGDVEESQLPPPLMTQYMLAKFRDMEADTHSAAAQAKDKKVKL